MTDSFSRLDIRWWTLAVCALALSLLVPLDYAAAGEEISRRAFEPASRGAGQTLFTKLEAAATGLVVDNAYDDPEMWSSRYREYMGGSMGSGVAVGDYDQDGYIDIYVSTKTKPGRLYKNLGAWTFEDVTEEAGLSEEESIFGWLSKALSDDKVVWRQGAVFADVDNDGWLDLYVCRNDAPNLLYINRGDGSFKEEASGRGLDLVDGSVVGAFADYDRDGWLDVLVLTNQMDGTESEGRLDRLFRNEGDGRFKEVTDAAGISGNTFGHSVVWFDYNGDGWSDFYIANDYAGSDYLYRNNGDGTFTNVLDSVAPNTAYSSMGTDTADINNDGYIDLFVGDMAATTREKERRRNPPASSEDVLLIAARNSQVPQFTRNALLLNTGRDYFREAACWAGIAATDWTWSVRFEDFDNDGWSDLHATNGMVREANNSDLLARMMRSLSESQRIGVMKKAPRLEESNLVFRNVLGTGFQGVTEDWGLAEIGVSFGAATADFDNDGDMDLVYLNHNGGLSVYRNDVTNQRRVQVRLRGTRSNHYGIGAIIRIESGAGLQSRTMSTSRGYASGSEVVAHFGLGSGATIGKLVVEWPSGIEQVVTKIDADFAYIIEEQGDVVEEQVEESPPRLFRENAEALGLKVSDASPPATPDKEQALLPFRTDRRGPGVAIGDVDGDGSDDIYIGATTGSPARLLRWSEGVYKEERVSGVPAGKIEDGPPLLLDVNGDGARDLIVTKASANVAAWPAAFEPILYSNDGVGAFSATDWLPKIGLNVGAACAADVDGDGDLDLFFGGRSIPGRYPETPKSVLLLNEGGRFSDVSENSPELGAVGLVKSALFRDVDGDGKPDLIVALEWDFVRYFQNVGGGRFSDWTEKAGFDSGGRGWWNGLACADFNGDGRPDFAAGNLGLNTPYEATRNHPATLYYGRFGQSASKVLIEGVYDGGTLYPRRSRGDIGGKLAHALRRYPQSDDYARASMTEVFGEKGLDDAVAYIADSFLSGVFLSQPDGSYRFAAFPRVAQIGPMQGVVAADFNGDGSIDLCASQNTDIAVPSFGGGVGILLLGDGKGSFEALEPAESGVVLPGFGRALALLDPDEQGRPSLFLTRHGGASEFLENNAGSARWVKIRLRGDALNRDAIGARVALELSNGKKMSYEIGFGGGWLSQSPPSIFAGLEGGGRVVEAVVTWPDGETSRHADPPEQGLWLIER